mmetsp:Transcript_37401/g.69091  ORF Transcript_37401/g.69091 Transcript_37401/m.69091 type:complete len:393 (-) Transcript_37401:183-1361(-)
MASSSDKCEPINLACSFIGAVAIFIMGTLLLCMGFSVRSKDEFITLNNMIKADITNDAQDAGLMGAKPTPDVFLWIFMICGPLMMIGACFGCCGAVTQNQKIFCPFYFFTLIAFLSFFIAADVNMTFSNTMDGIVERQALTFCHPQAYPAFKEQLGCEDATPTLPCGQECLERVELLKSMRGCLTLENMCHSFKYESMGRGLCLIGGKYPKTWRGEAGDLDCERICDHHPECSGTAYQMNTCFIVSTTKPDKKYLKIPAERRLEAAVETEIDWEEQPMTLEDVTKVTIDGADADPAAYCYKKGDPNFLVWATFLNGLVEEALLLSGVAVLIVMCQSCCVLFTQTTKRKGKKGACGVCSRMLCPCCIPTATRRIADDPEEDEEDEEEYDDDDI